MFRVAVGHWCATTCAESGCTAGWAGLKGHRTCRRSLASHGSLACTGSMPTATCDLTLDPTLDPTLDLTLDLTLALTLALTLDHALVALPAVLTRRSMQRQHCLQRWGQGVLRKVG
mmetsp:Transcript_47595/g.151906  ORF Transcript_47595/g.151906 Transcript_47595/m.151906 type:complete len:116 (-) Transcript_47595:923-1270(-)